MENQNSQEVDVSSITGMLSDLASPTNESEIVLEESNPHPDWKLPPVSANDVYKKLGVFNLKAYTQVQITESVVKAKLSINQMMPITLLQLKDVERARKKGYKFAHIGLVKIGSNALHRQGLHTFAFCALLDNRWKTFSEALIGGIQIPLSEGPVSFDVHPNFLVSLDDSNIMKVLTLGVQTKGYENFESESKNLSIFYTTCVRFYNTTIPAVLKAPSEGSASVTLIQYDSNCSPLSPQAIFKKELRPPESWNTAWNNLHRQPEYLSNHCIEEHPGQVITRFPQNNQSSRRLQHGESSQKMIQIDKEFYEKLKNDALNATKISRNASVGYVNEPVTHERRPNENVISSRIMNQLPSSTIPVHDRRLNLPPASQCSDPECNKYECVRKPFEINMLREESVR